MKFAVMTAVAVTLAGALAGCSAWPNLDAVRDPADPTAKVPRQRVAPVMAGTVDYRPVQPKSWIDSNQRVAPKSRGH
ncbi:MULTISPECIES: hypothetical protein [unclassified Beijerinckia]|uniref:hypothetical protein n=1 Tax=unclassified Beijerinckia TaxID=2638183 RepID=UPI0008960E08|nr:MULTISPECIES: hypothetical protein [unclassified Beijerinckia]MDH7794476.1 hypothetical protein [Beijerinckia sp. GAS462]SEB63608.1 hypothetical protein SAMN05443249_0748 [Beijerinckia sp. 28-YEA-48]